MIEPTKKQIDEAKFYILKRVQAESSVSHIMQKYLLEAANRIIKIAYKYNIRPSNFKFSAKPSLIKDVNKVINWLRSKLCEETYNYALIPSEDDKSKVIAFINGDNHGMTFNERMDAYMNRFADELEKFVAVGLATNLTKSALESLYKIQHKTIWTNSLLTQNGIGSSFGVGKSNVSFNMIDLLLRTTVADAWMFSDMLKAKNRGAKGFYSFRGSSYPCSYCDSKVGYHPMNEFVGLWHPRCKCYFVFI